jgi:hypothetical protein
LVCGLPRVWRFSNGACVIKGCSYTALNVAANLTLTWAHLQLLPSSAPTSKYVLTYPIHLWNSDRTWSPSMVTTLCATHFNIWKLCISPIQCTYGFHIMLKINRHFHKQHGTGFLYSGNWQHASLFIQTVSHDSRCKCLPLFQSVVSRDSCVLIQRTAF